MIESANAELHLRALGGAAIALAMAAALSGWLVRARLVVDRPNERSLHATPVPRTGGIAILIAASATMAMGPLTALPGALWMAALALAVLSFADDLWNLPVVARFGAHLAAGAGAAWLLLPDAAPLALKLAAVLGVGWMINLYNFMDGSDGLAGGMAVFGFGFLCVGAWMAGAADIGWACGVIAAAAAGFLVYNFHPARIFMGDVGSVPLGFLAACLGVAGAARGVWESWFPLLVFSPFIVDATVTLIRRVSRGARIWTAHREHYYQRLVMTGFGHRRTALMAYALMAMQGLSGLLVMRHAPAFAWMLLSGWMVVYASAGLAIDRRWRSHLQTEGQRASA